MPKEHRILRYSRTDDRIYPFTGSEKEGNSDGLHNTCEFYQPTGIAVEYDSVVYVCDTQTSCIKILTTLRKTSNFLNAIAKLFSAFFVHEKKKTCSLKSIAEAEALVKECKTVLEGNEVCIRNLNPSLSQKTLNGPQ